MPEPDIQPRKKPRQRRSAAMVDTIVTAAARVLAAESLAGFNTNRVAEVAGVSVGSVYQYFPNKAALLAALIERTQSALADAVTAIVQAGAGQPLPGTLAALARVAIHQQYSQPVLAAALDHEERRLPVHPVVSQAAQRMLASVAVLLKRHHDELAPDLPAAAAGDCLAITKALVEADSHRLRVPPADLADRIVRALVGYLSVRVAGTAESGR